MPTRDEFCLLQTSCRDRAEAEGLARGLIEGRLAACAQVHGPVQSFFHWQGEVKAAEEYLLQAKVLVAAYLGAEAYILERHSYELPECVAVPVAHGSPAFLAWWRACI